MIFSPFIPLLRQDAIITDTAQTATSCIKYCKENRLGFFRFLPLETAKVPNPSEEKSLRDRLQSDGRMRLACDVISCDDSIRKAVMNVVELTIICDDMDSAREICFGSNNSRNPDRKTRYKAVTIEGVVISKAGTMTGGNSKDSGGMNAGRFQDREIEALRERKDALEAERLQLDTVEVIGSPRAMRNTSSGRNDHRARIEELRNTVGNLNNKLRYTESDLSHMKKKMKEDEVLSEALSKQIDEANERMHTADANLQKVTDALEEAMSKVKGVEDEHFKQFREKTGMNDFGAYEEVAGKARSEYLKKRRSIREHLERLKAKKVYEDGRNFVKAIEKKKVEIDKLTSTMESCKKKEEKILASVSEAQKRLENIESELETLKESESQQAGLVNDALKAYKEFQGKHTKLRKAVSKEEAFIEELRAKLHEILQKARVEEAEIPLLGESNEGTLLDNRSSRAKRRSGAHEQQREEEDKNESVNDSQQSGIHFSQANDSKVAKDRNDANNINFELLRKDLKKRLSKREELKVEQDFTEKLDKFTSEIEVLTPNMKVSSHGIFA